MKHCLPLWSLNLMWEVDFKQIIMSTNTRVTDLHVDSHCTQPSEKGFLISKTDLIFPKASCGVLEKILKMYCNLSTAVQSSPLNQFLLENTFFRLPRPPLTSFHNGLGSAGGLCERSVETGATRAPVPECCSLAGVWFSVIRRQDSAFCHFHLMMAGFCSLQQLSCLHSNCELYPPRGQQLLSVLFFSASSCCFHSLWGCSPPMSLRRQPKFGESE